VGVSPSSVRKDEVMLKTVAPLKLKVSLEGGYLMDYKIVKKEAFTVIANAKTFPCKGAMPNALQDDNYYCEIWIPVKKK